MKITGICVHKKYRDREMYMDKECMGDTERGRYGDKERRDKRQKEQR